MALDTSILRLAHQGVALGQAFVNVSYWRTQTSTGAVIPQADISNLLVAIAARYVANIVPSVNNQYLYSSTKYHEVTGWAFGPVIPPSNQPTKKLVFGDFLDNAIGAGTLGGIAGECLPFTVASVIHWFTALAGRRNRGRMKVGPESESQSSGNQMVAGHQTALQTGAGTYRANFVSGAITFEMVVFSPTKLFAGPQGGPARNAGAAIITERVPLTFGTQRSRKYET